jgi:hypothetical protein
MSLGLAASDGKGKENEINSTNKNRKKAAIK